VQWGRDKIFHCIELCCVYKQHAKDLMSAAESHSGSGFLFSDIQKRLLRALQDAEKDNDFIYHAKIPEISSLTAISKAAVAKSIPMSSPMSSQFKGLTLQLSCLLSVC